MSFFIALIIIMLVWFFILAPFIRLIRISRQWRNTFADATRRARETRNPGAERKPKRPKKKIDHNVGEYVEFTETVDDRRTETGPGNDSGSSSAETESQIVDVSWEDIPEK